MVFRFRVNQWSAWAPGLLDISAWQGWLKNPLPLTDVDGSPALAEMPAMMRRRVEKLGRAALQSAYRALGASTNCPIVFASRYGDIARSIELLRQLAAQETLSPTGFSMSVHNAIGALFSIARGDTGQYTAIAAGDETVEAAFTEACGLLADGADSVLIVVYDEQLPDIYRRFGDEGSFPRAWACLISQAARGGVSLQPTPAIALGTSSQWPPADMKALQFLTSGAAAYHHTCKGRTWQWQRHD
ncbi:beta-ketoacyl synthase chain length factor [Undibacterium sp. TJN25]|uniref:beta-ketoacyl synthase chain length factor n=1 Tax=Undibacterium sp. TJN25 TaxID=3413056 RepID=UPI003BF31CE3